MAIYTTSIMPGIRLVCRVFIYVHGVIIGDFDSITANSNDIHSNFTPGKDQLLINLPAGITNIEGSGIIFKIFLQRSGGMVCVGNENRLFNSYGVFDIGGILLLSMIHFLIN